MKKFLGLLVLVATSTPIFADLVVLKDEATQFVVQENTGPLSKSTVLRGGQTYTSVALKDYENKKVSGAPEIPYKTILLQIPKGKDLRWEVQSETASEEILSQELSFLERLPIHDGKENLVKKDARAYQQTYGTSLVEVAEIDYMASEKIARIHLWPLRYDGKTRKLKHTVQFVVRFYFVNSLQREEAPVSENGVAYASFLVENKGATSQVKRVASKKDLVLYHPSYNAELFRLFEFKKSKGRTVKAIAVEGKTSAQVKELIAAEYKSLQPPSQTLLIGNLVQIPSFSGTSDNTWTDYPYQKIGNGTIPDVSVGRIPVNTPDELRIFLDKVIAREVEPREDGDILLTAGADTALGCPANVAKVGEKFKLAGDVIRLVKKYKTEVSTADVMNAYNDNPNIIVYDGHGNRTGMVEIPLLISGLNQLNNKTYPILLDIACLNANWSSAAGWKNFAASILLLAKHGVAGIMASGGSGYGHDFFQSIGEIMAKGYLNAGANPSLNEVGTVILAAKVKHGEQDRSFWNYYGDPATTVWQK